MKNYDFLELIRPFILKSVNCEIEGDIKKITADSREIEKGTVFFCIKGEKNDGHRFVPEAFEKGAVLAIGEEELSLPKYICVNSVKEVLKIITPAFYDFPDRKMDMVAVTGTNGKTSIVHILEKMLCRKHKCGVIGTLGYRFNGRTIDAANTTPLNWKWYSLLNEMHQCGTEVVVSEVSSHAIEEERIEKTLFDFAVFTNLSRDHLDFHGNIENYYNAKKKLFTAHLKKGGVAVINFDDIFGQRLYNEIRSYVNCVRISLNNDNVELKVEVKNIDASGSCVNINYLGLNKSVTIPLIGKFNIYNSVCAFAVCSFFTGVEYAFEQMKEKVYVPGRLERIGDENIFVDYAHSPDSLEKILITVREIKKVKRVIIVFGAGGDRDRGKRSLMGKVASEYSDVIIITDDNPRTENPDNIINDILEGCNSQNKVIMIINNRSEAIKKALRIKEKQDVVVIAGKGAENYQITKEGKRFFSDREEVEKYFRELQNVYYQTD